MHPKRVFISYAWPQDSAETKQLQARLTQIVIDLAYAKIEALLDIRNLGIGQDIDGFMTHGVDSSDCVLWIGTNRLKERIVFKSNGDPGNNVTVEFIYIQGKFKNKQLVILPLWFQGDDIRYAFPTNCFPVVGTDIQAMDFRVERKYFHQLPLLAAAMLGCEEVVLHSAEYAKYLQEVQTHEDLITKETICKHLVTIMLKKQQQESNLETQQLIAALPTTIKEKFGGETELAVEYPLSIENLNKIASYNGKVNIFGKWTSNVDKPLPTLITFTLIKHLVLHSM